MILFPAARQNKIESFVTLLPNIRRRMTGVKVYNPHIRQTLGRTDACASGDWICCRNEPLNSYCSMIILVMQDIRFSPCFPKLYPSFSSNHISQICQEQPTHQWPLMLPDPS